MNNLIPVAKRSRLPLAFVLAVAVIGFGGFILSKASSGSDAGAAAHKIQFYQDSMHPWIKSDKPGKCTICSMDLTPIYEGDKGVTTDPGMVLLSSNSITVLNVQTEEVKRGSLRVSLRVAGTLEADETRKMVFTAPAAGRIEMMTIESVGDEVEAEQPLFNFYSPELATWRRAYVVRNRSAGGTTPFFAGRPHEGIDMSPGARPARIPRAGAGDASGETDPYFSDLLSPLSGTVVERKVFNGQYVAEGDRLLTIVDTSVLWFRFDVYERQLPWLKKGQRVRVTVPAAPGREFEAVIKVIEPELNETTRTVKVRANLPNPLRDSSSAKSRLLRLGMYAEGRVIAEVPEVLTVVRSAVFFPGGNAHCYVEEGPGAYAMRTVKLGRQGDGQWEILAGLQEGERVVSSGNVLIDAQAQVVRPLGSIPADCGPMMTMAPVAQPVEVPDGITLAHETQADLEPAPIGPAMVMKSHQHERDHAPAPIRVESLHLPPGTIFGTANTRHPDARERLARSFAAGLTERHRMDAAISSAGRAVARQTLDSQEFSEAQAMARMKASVVAGQSARETAPTSVHNGNGRAELTQAQRDALAVLIDVCDGISRALAGDSLSEFNQQAAMLPAALSAVQKTLGSSSPWSDALRSLGTLTQNGPAKDLAEARTRFLRFSTASVELAKQLRKAGPTFAGVKIYYCSMAPKPGLWLQAKGPLRNPFYGSEMLTCGKEVRE